MVNAPPWHHMCWHQSARAIGTTNLVGTPYHPLLPQATARISRCMVGKREGAAAAAAGEPFLLLPSQRRRTIHITQPGRINPVLYRQDWLIYTLSYGCTPYNKRYTYSISSFKNLCWIIFRLLVIKTPKISKQTMRWIIYWSNDTNHLQKLK